MEHLGIPPGPLVGEALAFLLEIRLDEGEIGHDEAMKRLDAWWQRPRTVPSRPPIGRSDGQDGCRARDRWVRVTSVVRDDVTDGLSIRRRAAMWRWVLSVVVAAALLVALVVLVAAPRRRALGRRRRRRRRHRLARRRRGRRHVARVAAHHPPPQPHDRAPHRHRVRAAPAARRPARGACSRSTTTASCAAPTPRPPS